MDDTTSSARLMLNLGAGCTAPPPTPTCRPAGSIADACIPATADSDVPQVNLYIASSSREVAIHSDLAEKDTFHSNDGGGTVHNSSETKYSNSTPPSREVLDELAQYLAQHSFFSTPTLMASPLSRKKREISPRGMIGTNVEQLEISTSPTSDQTKDEVSSIVDTFGMESALAQNQEIDEKQYSVYTYSAGGFNEVNKMEILRACQERGMFYVHVVDSNGGKPSLCELDHVLRQSLSQSRMSLIGACPQLPISQLTSFHKHDENVSKDAFPYSKEETALELLFDLPLHSQNPPTVKLETLRETITSFARELVEVCGRVLEFLLEDICYQTQPDSNAHYLKPLLYMYENGNQEPHVSRCDDDVVLSVVSHYNACPKGGTEKGSLLVVLGSHMESWSRGKYKSQKFSSRHDYSDGEICIQLDLVLQL